MSTLKAIITTLVLGASTIAMAQPSSDIPSRDDRRYDERYDRRYDERYDRDWRRWERYDRDWRWWERRDRDWRWDRGDVDRTDLPRRYRSAWVSLAEPMELSYGRDTIDVHLRGTFTQLRLQTVAGTSYIHRVIVRFRDGSRQVVEAHRTLDPYGRMFQFLLDGNNRRLDSITVIGRSHRGAAIQVFGI